MCAVSAIYDAYKQIPPQVWKPDTFIDFQEIIKRLDALDKKLAQPECHDPAKVKWAHSIEKRLKKLETVKR